MSFTHYRNGDREDAVREAELDILMTKMRDFSVIDPSELTAAQVIVMGDVVSALMAMADLPDTVEKLKDAQEGEPSPWLNPSNAERRGGDLTSTLTAFLDRHCTCPDHAAKRAGES